MTVNQILDMAIVLVGVYAMLSCIVSWLNEKIASWLRLRGWNLFKGILALVDTHEMAAAIFNHPLIASTSPDSKSMTAGGATKSPSVSEQAAGTRVGRFWQVFKMKPPSYLDARNFSASVWQTIADKYPAKLTAAVAALPNRAGAAAPASGSLALAQLIVATPGNVLNTLSSVVQSDVPAGDLREQLSALLAEAQSDYNGLLAATDGWFNAQMDRVTGWYKREMQWIIAALALIVVTITGVDSIEMLKVLSATDAATLTTIAQSVDPNNDSQALIQSATGSAANGASPAAAFDLTKFVHIVRPTGVFANWAFHTDPKDPKTTYYRWPGLVVTYLAVVLGGSFWFDALKSLANVRSAGRKPSRTDQPPT